MALLHALGRGTSPGARGRAQPRPIIPAIDQPRRARNVAWSPDGRRLAVIQGPGLVPATPSAEPYRVTIYDCATGRALGQVTPQLAATMTEGDTGTLLRWSPDSARLLIFNGELGELTIAGPGQLPRA